MSNEQLNPPGMWTGYYGRLPNLDVYTPRMGAGMWEMACEETEHGTPEEARASAREQAWARYRKDMSPEAQAVMAPYNARANYMEARREALAMAQEASTAHAPVDGPAREDH